MEKKVAMDIAKSFRTERGLHLFSSAGKDGIKAVDVSYLLLRWAKIAGKLTKRGYCNICRGPFGLFQLLRS